MEWRVYYDETNFGELKADRRTSELLAMLYNVNRSSRQPARTSDYYMPKIKKRELTDEQIQAKMEAYFSSLE